MKKNPLIIKSKTIGDEKAKQYFYYFADEETSIPAIVVKKYVLTKRYDDYAYDSILVKQFNDFYLFRKMFAIKIETLSELVKWVYS